MKTEDKPDIFGLAIKIARGLGEGTLLPNNRYCGVYWNIEDYILKAFEDDYRPFYLQRHKFIAELNVRLNPLIMFWVENTGYLLDYPVPHPELPNEQAHYDVDDKWTDDKYGDAHRRLCLYIAHELSLSTPFKRWLHWITG